MVTRISLVTGASVAFVLVPLSFGASAQYYIGAQAGWTGLPYQTDTIAGQRPVAVQFNAGYNVGARGGYQLGPWRFEEEYSHRRNGVAEYDESAGGVSGNRHTNAIIVERPVAYCLLQYPTSCGRVIGTSSYPHEIMLRHVAAWTAKCCRGDGLALAPNSVSWTGLAG